MSVFKAHILAADGKSRQIKVSSERSLLHSCLKQKIKIDHSCEGNSTCGTCRVRLLQGQLSLRTNLELEWAKERNYAENERLSCQVTPLSDIVIEIT